MVLSAVLGRGVGLLSAGAEERVDDARVVLAGVRSTDPGELEGLLERGARSLTADELVPESLVAAVEATGAIALLGPPPF